MMKRLLLLICAATFLNVQLFSQTVVFSDDFEAGISNWVLEGNWGLTNSQALSGAQSLADSPGTNSIDSMNISATMATGVDLTNIFEADLNFSAIYEIEDGTFDFCFIEISGDDGQWIVLDSFSGTNFLPWKSYNYSLDNFIGNSDVKTRFRFLTDNGFTKDGIYIDDVSITTSVDDITAPTIQHTPPAFYESNIGNVTMEALIADNTGIGSATLFYTVEGGMQQMVSGVNIAADTFNFVIPALPAGSEIVYFVEVIDASTNANTTTTGSFSFIAGNHIFYDNGQVSGVNSLGPASTTGYGGAAVKMSPFGKTDLVYALIRNHREVNIANSSFQFHIWGDNNGSPGEDLIAPITVMAEATVANNDVMTRIDLRPFAADLSDVLGDVFVGITVPAGQTYVTETSPGVGNHSYVLTNSGWNLNSDVDYHFRLVTDSIVQPNECADAPDLSDLLSQGPNNPSLSIIYNNEDVLPTGNEPTTGWECWRERDAQGNLAPTLDNPLWYSFVGDGEKYVIMTTDCNGTAPDYINNGDTQMALYEGDACGNLTAIDCNEDADNTPPTGPFPSALNFQTSPGVTYFLLIDGHGGAGGDFCIQFDQTTEAACNDLALGTASASPAICLGESTDLTLDGFTLAPAEGQLNGFLWSIHSEDITGSMDPFNLPSWISNFALTSESYIPVLENGVNLPAGTYFFTPIVFADAFGTDANWPAVDFSQACMMVGPSVQIDFLNESPSTISVTSTSEMETTPPGNNGQASVQVTGGTGNYSYLWSNNETTATINNLIAGSYFVTVSDASPCVEDVIIEVIVDQSVGFGDPVFTEGISLQPNPAKALTNINVDLETSIDLEIRMTNSIGQEVLVRQLKNVKNETIEMDLSRLTNGVYLIHFSDGEKAAIKKLVIAK